ncbi:MAG: hypothetical protein GXP28_03610 [Planctomycetes bacterium]|nr:hypothetical protein [Planctomycetota bacterium]
MANPSPSAPPSFRWEPQPAAATLVSQLIERFLEANRDAAKLAQRMRDETGTRLVDWVDTIWLPKSLEEALLEVGFEPDERQPDVWHHPGGIFPRLVIGAENLTLGIKVSDALSFVRAHGFDESHLMGESGGRLRVATLPTQHETVLAAIERQGWRDPSMPIDSSEQIALAEQHACGFASRNRYCNSLKAGFDACANLLRIAIDDLGSDWACPLFFAAERDYWMSRNQAARVQYGRQQLLGLGWANHDHHTYRSSREGFHLLIGVLEQMGFQCRERFYAGREAGWGAQVLEHPPSGIVVFADVDLSPEEIATDFSHQPLPPREHLGTVGLWCALHGESLLEAGMHHLECQFDFDAARRQLAKVGVETMAPFTDFSFLKQAFTQGEIWPVRPSRIEAALSGGHISRELAEQFCRQGALGSHLEILERNDGYKGFNQSGVSDIILRTDPRKW